MEEYFLPLSPSYPYVDSVSPSILSAQCLNNVGVYDDLR